MSHVTRYVNVTLTCICVALFLASAAFAAGWEPMNVVDLPHPNGQKYYTTFMDGSTLKTVGRLRRVWVLMSYTEEQAFRGTKDGQTAFIHFRSVKDLDYFDCQSGRIAVAREEYYAGEMAAGKLLKSSVLAKSVGDLSWEKMDVKGYATSRVRAVCALPPA